MTASKFMIWHGTKFNLKIGDNNMITIDQQVNCLDCVNGKVYICSNSMQDAIDCKCNGKPDRYSGCRNWKSRF